MVRDKIETIKEFGAKVDRTYERILVDPAVNVIRLRNRAWEYYNDGYTFSESLKMANQDIRG